MSFCDNCCACEAFTSRAHQLAWCPGADEPHYDNLADFLADTNSCQEFNACEPVGLGCWAYQEPDRIFKMAYVFSFFPALWAWNSRCVIIHWFDLTIPRHYDDDDYVHLDGTSVAELRLMNRGSGYRSPPVVTIEGGEHEDLAWDSFGLNHPVQATAHAVVDTNPSSPTFTAITAIVLDSPGSLYSMRPAVTIEDPPANGTAVLTALVAAGAVIGVSIDHDDPPLRNYRKPPHVGFSSGNARAHAVIDPANGKLLSIVIDDGGSGYTSIPEVIIDLPPEGAAPIVLPVMTDDVERTWEWDQTFPAVGAMNPITGENYTENYKPPALILSPMFETQAPAEPSATFADVTYAYAKCHDCG